MTGWPLVALADCCHIVSGATPKTSVAPYWDGDIDWVTPKDLSRLDGAYIHETPRRITKAGLASCGATVLPPQSVLFSSRAPIGHVAINTVPMATNQGFKSLIPHANRVDAKYLFHWLRTNRSYLEGLGNGATFKEVSKAIVSRIEIPLPPLDHQRRIAAILDQADALRVKRLGALAHLDDLTLSIFRDMFGEPDSRNPQWPTSPLSDIVTNLQGGRSLVASDSAGASINRVLKISAVTQMHFRPEECKAVPDDYVPPADHFVKQGDLLFSRANTTELVGALAYVWDTPSNLLLPDKLWRFVWTRSSDVEPLYIWALFQTKALRRELSSRSSGTGGSMKNISQAKLLPMQIALPPHDLQARFASNMAAQEQLKTKLRTQMAELDCLFESLQTRAFAGQL